MKKIQKMKYLSYKDKTIIEIINIINKIIQKVTIRGINIIQFDKDHFCRPLLNLIKLKHIKILIRAHQRKRECLKILKMINNKRIINSLLK